MSPKPDPEKIARVEGVNRWICSLLGGDRCTVNVDRIMRLPGTANVPNAKKRSKGRTVTQAKVVHIDTQLQYGFGDFQEFYEPSGGGSKRGLKKSGPVEVVPIDTHKIGGIDDLDQYGVSQKAKTAILRGKDPENPNKGDNTRSGWVWYVVCNLLARGVPDGVIKGILLDDRWRISESILELGAKAEGFAERQIARAKEVVRTKRSRGPSEKPVVLVPGDHGRLSGFIDVGTDKFCDELLKHLPYGTQLFRHGGSIVLLIEEVTDGTDC